MLPDVADYLTGNVGADDVGPDYGGVFRMNPGEVYLSDAEYEEMIEKIKQYL